MTELNNEIIINGEISDVWNTLNTIDILDQYDPTVKKSVATSKNKIGLGSSRKVEMKDGKNWFEEICTISKPNETLQFELTACSFPVHSLQHTYSFEENGNQVKVKQVMKYKVKFGFIGKIMDTIMIRKQSDKGIKLFMQGLKKYIEQKDGI